MKDLVLQPMSLGQVLDGAFALYRRHLAPMVGVVALLYGPVMTASLLLFGSFATYTPEPADVSDVLALSGGLGILYLVAMLAYTAVQGALTRAVSNAFLGQRVSIGDACRAALRRLLPLVGGGLLKLLLILVIAMLGMVVLVPIAVLAGVTGADSSIFGFVGGLLGVLAVLSLASVAWAMFFAVTPVIMLEDAGPTRAIVRSARLARGRWIRILAVLGVALLIPAAMWVGGSVVAGFLVPNAVFAQVVGQVIALALMPYYAICVVLLYYDARIRSEGFDLAVLAQRLRPASGAT
jgi:hypothetical protein